MPRYRRHAQPKKTRYHEAPKTRNDDVGRWPGRSGSVPTPARKIGQNGLEPSLVLGQYEKIDPETGERYTWCQRESLEELQQPERIAEIKRAHEEAMRREKKHRGNRPLVEILADVYDDENDEQPCFFCHF